MDLRLEFLGESSSGLLCRRRNRRLGERRESSTDQIARRLAATSLWLTTKALHPRPNRTMSPAVGSEDKAKESRRLDRPLGCDFWDSGVPHHRLTFATR